MEYYKYQEQFWCYKITRNSNLINEMEYCKLKKYITFFECIYRNGKSNYKNWWHWHQKTKTSPTQKTCFKKKKKKNRYSESNNR